MTRAIGSQRLAVLVRRRWRTMALVAIAFSVAALAIIRGLAGQYQARAVVRIDDPHPAREYVAPTVTEPTIERLSSSRLGLLAHPVVERAGIAAGLISASAPAPERERAAAALAGRLDARAEGQDTFIVTFLYEDPDAARAFLTGILKAYTEVRAKEALERARGTAEFFNAQVNELRVRLEENEGQVERFRALHDGALPEQLEGNMRLYAEMQMAIHSLSASVDAGEGRRRDIMAEAASLMRRRVEDVGRALSEARVRYAADAPEVAALHAELRRVRAEQRADERTLNSRVRRSVELATVEAFLARTQGQIVFLQTEQESLRRRIEATARNGEELARMSVQRDLLRERLHLVMTRHEEAIIAAGLEEAVGGWARVAVVEPSWVSPGPVKPPKLLYGLVAIAMSLLLALGFGYLLEMTDQRVRDASDVEDIVGRPRGAGRSDPMPSVPLLGVVPRLKNPSHGDPQGA